MEGSPMFSGAPLLASHNELLEQFERREATAATAMRRAVLAEVPSYPASGEPGYAGEVQQHALEHVRAFIACARHGSPPAQDELDFVRERAVQREQEGVELPD